MGRKSSLSEKQWAEVRELLLNGEPGREIARKYKVSPARISEYKTKFVDPIKDAANQLVSAECSVKSLRIQDQHVAFDYASKLR